MSKPLNPIDHFEEKQTLRAELESAKAETERLRENERRWMNRTSLLSVELHSCVVELATALPLLRRWCGGCEEIDRRRLRQVYEETEKFLAECEKGGS